MQGIRYTGTVEQRRQLSELLIAHLDIQPAVAVEWTLALMSWRYFQGGEVLAPTTDQLRRAVLAHADGLRSSNGFRPPVVRGDLLEHWNAIVQTDAPATISVDGQPEERQRARSIGQAVAAMLRGERDAGNLPPPVAEAFNAVLHDFLRGLDGLANQD